MQSGINPTKFVVLAPSVFARALSFGVTFVMEESQRSVIRGNVISSLWSLVFGVCR